MKKGVKKNLIKWGVIVLAVLLLIFIVYTIIYRLTGHIIEDSLLQKDVVLNLSNRDVKINIKEVEYDISLVTTNSTAGIISVDGVNQQVEKGNTYLFNESFAIYIKDIKHPVYAGDYRAIDIIIVNVVNGAYCLYFGNEIKGVDYGGNSYNYIDTCNTEVENLTKGIVGRDWLSSLKNPG